MRIDLCLMRLMRLLWNSEVEFGELAAVRLKKWKWCKKWSSVVRLEQFWRACTETLFLQNKWLICPNWDWDRITGRPAAAFVKHKRPEFWAPTDVATSKQFTPDYGPGCVHSSTNTAGNRAQIQLKIQSKYNRIFSGANPGHASQNSSDISLTKLQIMEWVVWRSVHGSESSTNTIGNATQIQWKVHNKYITNLL